MLMPLKNINLICVICRAMYCFSEENQSDLHDLQYDLNHDLNCDLYHDLNHDLKMSIENVFLFELRLKS